MGKAMSDGKLVDAPAKAPEEPRNLLDGEFVSMGERARWKKEKAESDASKPPTPDPAKPAATPPADKKTETPPVASTPPAAPPEAPKKKPIEVQKAKPIEEIVEGVVRRIVKETPPEAAAPAPKKEEPATGDPDAAFVESLDEDQKEAFELAQYAAKAMPDKYGNMPKRTVEYLKKVDSYIDEKRKEDPEWDPENDESFATFIEENRPTYQAGDRKRLERQQIADEVRADVKKEFLPQIEESKRITRAQELKPEIEKAAQSYVETIAQRFVPDDKSPFSGVLKVVSEKGFTDDGWKEARQVDPLAAATAQTFMNQAQSLGREYLELVSGVSDQVQFNPKAPITTAANQKAIMQQRLFGFIDQQEALFAQQGGDMRVINGKSFVPRRELAAMPPSEQAKHWTLGHSDVLDMLAVEASRQAEIALKTEIQRREAEGYVRNGKHGLTKKEDGPPPAPSKKEESPRTTVTPAPGAANPPPTPPSPTVFTEDDLKRQWQGGASMWPG